MSASSRPSLSARSSTSLKSFTTLAGSDAVFLDNKVEDADIPVIAEKSKRLLYLGTDAGEDSWYACALLLYFCTFFICECDRAPRGFTSFSDVFKSNAYHVPFDTDKISGDLDLSLQTYRRIESVLNLSAEPIAIVPAPRASAVLAAQKAIQENWSDTEIAKYAAESGLSYASVAPLARWVGDVVKAARPAGKLVFRQLFESQSSTYTYLLADADTGMFDCHFTIL